MKKPGAISVELQVPFHDVDPLHVVWHGHYYKYLEVARTELMRAHQLDVADMIALGHRFYVIETHCRYVSPLRYGDRFVVEAWYGDVNNRVLVSYEITNLTLRRRAARARTVLVTTDADGRLLLETPDAIRRRLPG